jgi:hypothetical protein
VRSSGSSRWHCEPSWSIPRRSRLDSDSGEPSQEAEAGDLGWFTKPASKERPFQGFPLQHLTVLPASPGSLCTRASLRFPWETMANDPPLLAFFRPLRAIVHVGFFSHRQEPRGRPAERLRRSTATAFPSSTLPTSEDTPRSAFAVAVRTLEWPLTVFSHLL